MQTNLEQTIEIIKTLPPEDFEKVREVFNEVERNRRNKDEKLNWRLERYKKARKWLDEHSVEYMNEWVCLEGDQLIAHGKDGLEVHNEAIKQGIESPFLHHIVEEPKYYTGGW